MEAGLASSLAPDLEAERGHDEAGGDQERRERMFGGGRAVDLADQQSAVAAFPSARNLGKPRRKRARDTRSIGFRFGQVDQQLPPASEIRGELAIDHHDLRADRAGWTARQAPAGLACALAGSVLAGLALTDSL